MSGNTNNNESAKDNVKAFLTELKALMEKHKIDGIDWACGEGSDTYGIYEEHMIISAKGNRHQFDTINVVSCDGSSVGIHEIDEMLKKLG